MKKFKFGSRVLALILTFIMVLSLVPASVLAAVGDIYTGTGKGTGIVNSTLNQDGTINWPIKVYDYLSDGMLFEFAQNGASVAYTSSKGDPELNTYGGQYVLGQPMPYAVYGHDFTTDKVYSDAVNTSYTSSETKTYKKTKMSAVDYTNPQYMRISWSGSTNTSYLNCMISNFVTDHSGTVARDSVRYMALVYRASGLSNTGNTATNYINFNVLCGDGEWRRPGNTIVDINGNYVRNTSGWTAVVIDLYQNSSTTNWSGYGTNGINSVYIRLGLDSSSDYFDVSHIAYFSDADSATEYGQQCLAFINEPGEYISGTTWNGGNNTAFGMLFPSNGALWPTGGGTNNSISGSASTGYYTHQIGYRIPAYDSNAATYNANRLTGTDSTTGRFNGTGSEIGENGIYYITSSYYTSTQYQTENPGATSFDMSGLDFGGYNLLTQATSGLWTAGLLDSTLGADGTPVYKQETVEYIADLLSKTLTIPQYAGSDSSIGYANYNYVAGVKNREQFGYTVDSSGNQVANDLAQGLRNCLGIYFTSGANKGSTPTMGTYAETIAKADKLKGEFLTCSTSIKTCMDAAYYLLHNLFVDDSYNQTQDDFRYLTLSSAELEDGGTAYVFDGGFSQGASLDDLIAGTVTQEEYKAQTQNAVEYSGYNTGGDGTISINKVDAKDYYYYQSSYTTTRYPFLPVVDSEGVYAGQTDSYYFAEDDKRNFDTELGTYYDRNYGYTLVSNGEFVYNEEDGLFFEFEGDDDVYLFINGELVLDIGGGHSISNCSFEVNDYVYWAREVLKNPENYTEDQIARAEALDLDNGEIATFDFYYMERHGVGANMRIVTNMHITDPALRVEKSAYQAGKEIDYGGIVDADDPIEYNFALSNIGNTKLYNLTLNDANIGVTLDPDNGLFVVGDDTETIDDDINGYIVTDARGERLDAQDLTAVVTGYQPVDSGGDYIQDGHDYIKVAAGTGTHIYYDAITVTFTDNEHLKSFLKTLESTKTDTETVDEELTQQGSGLWVDSTVTFKGIYYTMTDEQETAGMFENTVYVTATTKSDLEDTGSETLRSEARHRVYVTAIPSYYQWAGHDLFVTEQQILDDATAEAGNTGSMLNDYVEFFNTVNCDTSKIYTSFADRMGNKLTDADYQYVDSYYDANSNWGFKTCYEEAGIYEFFLLMFVQGATGDVSTMNLGEYAIVRVLIIVADVGDAEYVLDYGLTTDNLDKNGILFQGDELYGSMSGTQAKLMGFSNTEPSYLNVTDKTSDYNRIDFTVTEPEGSKITTDGGYYTVNMAIPEEGRTINYNEYSGMYTLTDTGTVLIHADTPVSWENLYLYYWYDDGRDNVWPGEAMTMTSHGNFEFAIPSDVPHIIISNGTYQTADLNINPGMEAWIDIDGTLNNSNLLESIISYKTADGILHIAVPSDWGDVYFYCWDTFGNGLVAWPGTKIEEVDADGYYTCTIPGDITNVIVNNGDNGKQTSDQVVYAGDETWLTVHDTVQGTNEELSISYYGATATRSTDTVTFHASVPYDWNAAYLYYWNGNGSSTGVAWPGIAMTKGEDGIYYLDDLPADITNVIINDGTSNNQTEDLIVTAGIETWIYVNDIVDNTKAVVTVPDDWGDVYFYFCNDNDVGASWPGTAATSMGDNTYFMSVPFGATKLIVNNNDQGKQTEDLLLTYNITNQFNVYSSYLSASVKATKLTLSVPSSWTDVYVYYWNYAVGNNGWPGASATKNDDGTYSFTIPAGYNSFIVNNGSGAQTGDITSFYMGSENIVTVYEDGGCTVASAVTAQAKYTANIVYGENAEAEGFTFTPTKFMDSMYSIWMAITVHETDINTSSKPTALGEAINIGKEVQMFKKVTVLPANVVYYEDDFAGITYNYEVGNAITHYGNGSGSLSQSVDQSQQYGQDSAYQGSENDEITGGSLTDVYINNGDAFASFEFTGTGFEIIGHTHAEGSGTLMVTLYDSQGNRVKRVPVVTEYDNGDDGGSESIVSVPVIRISGLEFGTYKVELSGVPVYDWSNWIDKTQAPPISTSYLCIDGIRVYQPINSSNDIVARQNLALNKSYEGANVAEAGSLKGYYYTANLTDGEATDYIDSTAATGREGWFGYHRTLNVQTTSDGTPYGEFILDLENEYSLDEFRLHVGNYALGAPGWIDIYVSSDATSWTYVGSPGNIDYTQPANPYWAELALDKAVEGRYVCVRLGFYSSSNWWVMLNEVEVYGSKTISGAGVHDSYIDDENGATFAEIRDLISGRQAFAIKYDDIDGLSVSGGTNTWIENRNSVVPGDHNTAWNNNSVNSVSDYLLAGPNNEVYMIESTEEEKSALAFYVTETGSDLDAHNMQIAIRALDYNSYIGSSATGHRYAEIQYGAEVDGELVWKTLTTTVSSAEQYFTIPYTECPYDADNDRYQVVLRVADTTPTGMASYTSLKYNGLELLTLNTSEIPDVVYNNDELGNSLLLDGAGNTLSSSNFVGFITLVDQMTSDTVVDTEDTENSDSTDTEEETITGVDTSALGVLYDTFTADTSSDFAITEDSKIYVVTTNEAVAPAQEVLDTALLAQRQFAADGYDMDVVWGLAKYASAGDILVYVNSGYNYGAEEYKLVVTDRATIYSADTDALLYGLNTLQKHFRLAETNAIKGFTLRDMPDTQERTVHLDVARKYLTPDYIKNFIAEMSWMGYNSIELHMSEDGGFRMDFWGDTALNEVEGMTGNDFSWVCGSEPAYWVYSQYSDAVLGDTGKYLTTEEVIEICETAKEYHIDIIPSFDTPAHVDYMTKLYYNTVQANSSSPIRYFTYNGTNYTLPTRINYRNTGADSDWCVLDLGNEAVKNFAYAMYNDIAAFFAYYAGSTKFNIGADEVGLKSTDTWNYNTDFVNYVNSVNGVLKNHGYRARMYNDFLYNTNYSTITSGIDTDIDVVYWLAATSSRTYLRTASFYADQGRTVYSGVNFWTYYVLRIAPDSKTVNKDARDPLNIQWEFYRNQEDYVYDEWSPSQFGAYTDTNMGSAYNYSGEQLGGAYFMVWNDFAGLNTEVEIWNGCYDEHGNGTLTNSSGNGNYYSLIERMWSNAVKQWNSDINSTLTFANYETLRDAQGYFPGYVETPSTQSYINAMNLPEEVEVEEAYRTYHTVTYVNYDGTVLGTQEVKEGYSASYTGNTPTKPATVWYTYTFSGWDVDLTEVTSDITATAQYTSAATVAGTVGYLELKSSGGSNIYLTLNQGTSRPVGTEYMNSSMDFGVYATVKAVTNNDNDFVGWVNAKTGEIVSTDATYSFYTSGNDVLIAMYAVDSENKSLVTFVNDKTNQILDIQYYTADDIITYPTVLDYPGYKFAGWDLTDAQILAKLNAGEDITVTTTWTTESVYVQVVVNGGTVQSSGGGGVDNMYAAYKGMVVLADDAQSGKKFAYWQDEQGRIVSYDAEYKFYPYKATELTAVYVDEGTAIDYKVIATVDIDSKTLGDANTVFFSWDTSAVDYEIVNTGVLLVKKEHYLASTFAVGTINVNVIQYVTNISHKNSQAGNFSVTIPSVSYGDTWVAKSYVQYKDANGVIRTVYSDLCEATKVEA